MSAVRAELAAPTRNDTARFRMRCLLATVALAVLALSSSVAPVTAHAQSRQACKRDCKDQKKACLAAFKNQFKARKGQCAAREKSDRRDCKRVAKNDLKAGRRDCKHAFKSECKLCCKGDATGCALTVCGDGTLGPGEECDVGDRVDGDGCSATCLAEGLPDGPLGTRVFSLSDESRADSRFVQNVGSPTGTIVLEALEPDANGVAEVRSVGGPFFVTTDVQLQLFGLSVRICSRVDSCTGQIYCNGGANVDAIVELDSLAAGLSCQREGRCAGAPCCENACEGFVDPDATPVIAVGSGNVPVNVRVADMPPAADSGPGAMILTCQQVNIPFDLATGPACDAVDYGDTSTEVIYTTGATTARVLNHCAADSDDAGQTGTAPNATTDLTAMGENFSCLGWSNENGPGALANAIPQEEPVRVLRGDTTFATVLHD